jgi:hypothetical protein
VIVGVPALGPDPLAGVEASEYHLEQRASCPPANLAERDSSPAIGTEVDSLDNVRLRISSGDCLIRKAAKLQEANLIVVDRPLNIEPEQKDALDRGMLIATQVAAFRPSRQGFSIVFRRTAVTTRPLIVPWVLTRDGEWLSKLVFLRHDVSNGDYAIADVLRSAFGYKLAIPPKAESDRWPLRTRLQRGLAKVNAGAGDPDLAGRSISSRRGRSWSSR